MIRIVYQEQTNRLVLFALAGVRYVTEYVFWTGDLQSPPRAVGICASRRIAICVFCAAFIQASKC